MKISDTPDILKKIIEDKAAEIEHAKKNCRKFAKLAEDLPPPRNFQKALVLAGFPAIIAEVKKASPSKGIIAKNFNPVEQARAFCAAGADAISVLTEKNHFLGDIAHLHKISVEARVPVLRKDFIVHEAQIYESRAHRADSFLLIAAALSERQISDFISLGRELGMEPLVEVHDIKELEVAVECGAKIIGVNSRNLRTFEVSLDTAIGLAKLIPGNCVSVAESGIKDSMDVQRLFNAGYSAFLIGETLMKKSHESLKAILTEFKGARRGNTP